MKTKSIRFPNFSAVMILVVFLGFTQAIPTIAQTLQSFYSKKEIKLQEVPGYGATTNWRTLFPDASKVEYGKNTGLAKQIVVTPEGSVFMCHKTLYEIWKFDKEGNLVKKFGSKGSKPGQFPFHFSIYGLLDGKYLFTSDCQGRIMFFDTEGRFIKKLQLEYMPMDMVPLKNSKIAILGLSVGKPNRFIIVIKDFLSGNEKRIWTHTDQTYPDNAIVVQIPGEGTISMSVPYSHSSYTTPRLAVSKTGNLLVGFPDNGDIAEYSANGIQLKKFNLNLKPLLITDDEIQKNYEKFVTKKEEFAKKINSKPNLSASEKRGVIEQFESQLSRMKDRRSYPDHLPFFSSLIIDSDGNILVFEFTGEEENNKFNAYAFDTNGKVIGTSSFSSDNLELGYIPSKFSFCNGYIYAIGLSKQAGQAPLRLAKFRMN